MQPAGSQFQFQFHHVDGWLVRLVGQASIVFLRWEMSMEVLFGARRLLWTMMRYMHCLAGDALNIYIYKTFKIDINFPHSLFNSQCEQRHIRHIGLAGSYHLCCVDCPCCPCCAAPLAAAAATKYPSQHRPDWRSSPASKPSVPPKFPPLFFTYAKAIAVKTVAPARNSFLDIFPSPSVSRYARA